MKRRCGKYMTDGVNNSLEKTIEENLPKKFIKNIPCSRCKIHHNILLMYKVRVSYAGDIRISKYMCDDCFNDYKGKVEEK